MDDLVGQNLGPYRITEPIGMGGMATVYKAYQPSMERHVAIKVLPRHFASDPTFTGRFQQEARVIAKLEHARILPVYDFGEHEGVTYIVMRYLDAGTLADHLKTKEMSLDEMARIITQVAEGLDYAHSKGIIHRDIKPANIMLAESGNVYVTDFGISKLMEGTAQFTGSGIVGTPTYVSPEQGLGLQIDHRTDIYSLGVVLYQMATGSVPYKAETPMAVVIKHIHEPLPMPRSVKPDLSEPVERVILKAMAKEPDARYASCGEMAQALQAAVAEVEGEPIPAYEQTTEISTPTKQAVDIAPETLAAPVAPGDDASTLPAVPLPEDDASTLPAVPIPAEKPARRGWILPVAIVGGLIVVGLIIGAVLLFGGGLSGLTGEEAAKPTKVAAPEEATPKPPLPPDAGEGEEKPPEGAMLPGCKGDQPMLFATDFSEPTEQIELLSGAEIAMPDDGKPFLVMNGRPDFPALFHIWPEASNSIFMVEIILPEGEAIFKLHTRSVPEKEESYTAVYTPDKAVQLERFQGGVMEIPAGPIAIPSLADGQPHVLALHARDVSIALDVDGKGILEWADPEALPPGVFTFEVLEGMVIINSIIICGDEKPMAGGVGEEPFFVDNFDLARLGEQWRWINEPGEWALVEGQLMIPVLPNTGVQRDPDAASERVPLLALSLDEIFGTQRPGLITIQVDVNVHPHQNYQAAGLVAVSENRIPLVSLMRAYCDRAEYCLGNAIHFDYWPQFLHTLQEGGVYRPMIAGLEDPEIVTLRLTYSEEGNFVTAFYSLNGGETWEPVGEWPLTAGERLGFIGLMTSSGGQAVEVIPALFDNFVILPGG